MPYRLAIAHHASPKNRQKIRVDSDSNPRYPEPQSGALTNCTIPTISVLEGIRTPDPRLRRPLLYPTELQTHILFFFLTAKALGKRVMGIEPTYLAWKASVLPLNYTRGVGVTGFEPATSWSQTRRSSQAEPHPVVAILCFCFCLCP